MELQINNQTKTYPHQSLSVQQLLDIEKPNNQKGIAVAIANKVIPKVNWASYFVKHGDCILIITATQGG